MWRRGRRRFAGAGASAEREFSRRRRKNVRDDWKLWGSGTVLIVAAAIWSFYVGRVGGRLLAALSGAMFGVLLVLWNLGGHVSAFHWWLGAEGERSTANEIEKLGVEWFCEHDVEFEHGNWDHVLVGPPGVFLLDSKLLHGTAAAGGDALRSGRMSFHGSAFRGGALRVNAALEERLGGRAPWVQAVVVVWGDFPQGRHEERDVVYVRGEDLISWLDGLQPKLNAPQRAALVTALGEVRGLLQPIDKERAAAAGRNEIRQMT